MGKAVMGAAGDVGDAAPGGHPWASPSCTLGLCHCSEGLAAQGFSGWKTYGWVGAGPGDAEEHQELHAGLAGAKSLSLVPCHALL